MLPYWSDVASDFSRFHRVRPVEGSDLSAPEFFAMAYRLEVYGGAVALAVTKAHRNATPAPAEEMSFDDWVGAHPQLLIDAANRMGGDKRG